MKKYVVKNPVRFVIILLVCLFLFNGVISKEYKNVYTDDNEQLENLKRFIKEFSVIPKELREQIKEEEEFILLDIPLSEDLQKFCFETCKEYNMDYIFVLSVFATESEFKSYAKCKNQVGNGYSVGIGQLNENYTKWFSELTGIENFDVYNDKHNIEGSIAVLKFYRDYWKNNVDEISEEELWYFTLNSYNMGINGYKSYIRNTGETSRHYDRKVLKNKIKLENGGIE